MPPRNVLAIGAVALVGLALVVAVAHIAGRSPAPAALRIAQTGPSQPAGAPGTPSDQATPFAAAPTATSSPTPTPRTTPTPTPTPSMTPLTILTPRLRARPGQSVTMMAMTAPRTTCSINAAYSPAPQLAPATSSAQGVVSWKWTVSLQVRPDIYQILVTCGSGSAGATITVS